MLTIKNCYGKMAMKKILGIVVLGLFLITPSQADDIRDFQIEGMSIGDSALDYYSYQEINSSIVKSVYKDDEYFEVDLKSKKNTYERITLMFKKNDDNFLIHSIRGYNSIDFQKCKKKSTSVIKEIKSTVKITGNKNYKSKYQYGKSFALVSDLKAVGGSIRIWCDNWDENNEIVKQNRWNDAINVDISTEENLFWLNNKAYK